MPVIMSSALSSNGRRRPYDSSCGIIPSEGIRGQNRRGHRKRGCGTRSRTPDTGAEGLEVRLNSPDADSSNSHLLLHGEFPDFAALERYATHPAHLEFVGFIRQYLAENGRSCIDYQT